MAPDSPKPTPPEGLPDQTTSALTDLDAADLRRAIIYAQELLQFRKEPGPPIEPNAGEDILRVTEHDGYTEVVKHSHPGEEGSDGDRGPYLYHVTQERHPDGTEKPHWTFIGVVTDEE
jgi:hypothetical protein